MENTSTRVAILASSEKTQLQLSDLLEDVGLNVVARDLPSDHFLTLLEEVSPDVILVDLSEANGSETDMIDTLLDFDELPILFNDSSPAGGGANKLWAKQLARKLAEMASRHTPTSAPEITLEPIPESTPELTLETVNEPPFDTTSESDAANAITAFAHTAEVDDKFELVVETDVASAEPLTIPASEPEQLEITTPTIIEQPLNEESGPISTKEPLTKPEAKPEGAAVNFWVLGASLGGPQAVRQFLAAIKSDLPVAFILAQHIGGNHISLLAEQLDRVTSFKVLPGRSGHLLRHHEVVLAPADKNIGITDDGFLSLLPPHPNAIYSPSIDNAMAAAAKHYGQMAGTIVFSGMGDDGAKGCVTIAENGGIVWAQDDASCVISSMPDQARKTNTVTYSANPRTLAEKLYQYYSDAPG